MRATSRLLLLLAASMALTSCNFVSDMSDTYKKAETVSVELEKRLGVRPVLTWLVNSSTGMSITVTFPADRVSSATAGELYGVAREAVRKGFPTMPQQLTVAMTSSK